MEGIEFNLVIGVIYAISGIYMLVTREIQIGLGGGKGGGARPLVLIRIYGKTVVILAWIWIASAIAVLIPFVLQSMFTTDSAADMRIVTFVVVFTSTILAPIIHMLIESDAAED